MNTYVTGAAIKSLRERQKLTQAMLAEKAVCQRQNHLQMGNRQGLSRYFAVGAAGGGAAGIGGRAAVRQHRYQHQCIRQHAPAHIFMCVRCAAM